MSGEWIASAEKLMSLADDGRRDEALAALDGPSGRARRAAEQGVRRMDPIRRGSRAHGRPHGRRDDAAHAARRSDRLRARPRALRRPRRPDVPPDRSPDPRPPVERRGDRRRRLPEGGAVHEGRPTRPASSPARSTCSSAARWPWTSSAGSRRTPPGSRGSCRAPRRSTSSGPASSRRSSRSSAAVSRPSISSRARQSQGLRRIAGYGLAAGSSRAAAVGRGPRGPVRAGAQADEPGGHPARLPAHRLGRRRGRSGPGHGLARDVPGRASRGPRVRVVPGARRQREGPARRAAAGRRDEPRDPGPQHPDAGAARPDAGAGAAARGADRRADAVAAGAAGPEGRARGAAGGARGGAGEGRGGDAAEVDVPRQHEPRDPDADERHHRPVAPRAEDRADPQAARLPRQGPQRRDVAARDHQRHPRFLEDRGGQARHRDDAVPARRGDLDGHDRGRAEGAREGPRVSGRRPGRRAAEPAWATRCAWVRS